MRIFVSKLAFLVLAVILTIHTPIANAALNPNQTEEILASRTNQFLADRGFRLSDSNWVFFERAIQKAATDISRLPPKDRAAELEKASANIRLFIDLMSQTAESKQGYGKRLGESTLDPAMKALCPLWPFCD